MNLLFRKVLAVCGAIYVGFLLYVEGVYLTALRIVSIYVISWFLVKLYFFAFEDRGEE